VNPVEIRTELHILEKAGTGTHERAKIGEILWDIYETCINAFQEIKAISASNLAGGYHAGVTVPMAVISRVNRTTRAIHPGSLDDWVAKERCIPSDRHISYRGVTASGLPGEQGLYCQSLWNTLVLPDETE
jgi:hypothetical protein